ncbi:MAG TPA: LON peptidase substrate-binding domain-containing protein [Polyangiaceae bacterium LLY-WYZ-15_(1-7)]|nr:LON peptidase substrate-binding domain-containing protein [Polyangiaceae bacterium LLY-WYZ-15_(1-7)]HJL12414.1 LON peptidase substrate-binding domain-containing protein [Polyangiaceae bacterium LLY-WYZ-15_(1-7)]HJL21232.1 LON peptidase substrate-binding domain-containing protein [Polyangiaceae bacterium LLY-WYZ-15_(1-7)]HJL33177.1 LON peptidase substrate-binding domain-containing protein [Polyangiaceae bacterium LLY-WYZ-15_(1-7)]HJL36797.1 LON peptidase substrate-binding domain-containing pr
MTPEAAPLAPEELARLPVFPLPRVVFFPGTLLPLHLFEPRYRAMIEDCLEKGPKALAIALLKPGYETDYDGKPAIHAIAGAGRILAHEKNADGTHDIVLQGMTRVSLEELEVDTPYRVAKATPLEDQGGEVPRSEVTTLLACATQVAQVVRQQHPEFALGVSVQDPPHRVADTVADRFVAEPARRQAILEALDVRERLSLVTDSVGELLAHLASHEAPS